MGRIAVPTTPPSSGAVVFYARARYDATKHSVRSPGVPLKAQGDYQGEQDDAEDSTTSDPDKTLLQARLSSDTNSQSSTDTKVERISDSGKLSVTKGSKQATVFALSLIKDVLEVFSEVPYVQILARAVQQVILISEEITANKERCAELVEKVALYSKVVFDALLELKKPCPELERLQDDLEQISSVLDGIQKLLTSMAISNKSIIRRVLGREDVLQKLGEYDRKLDTSITLFQLKSSIVLRVNAKQNFVVPTISTSLNNGVSLPKYTRQYSKPHIMIGRDDQISELVTDFLGYSRAQICVLGPGGVGKTSLALSVFHDDAIIRRYGDNRYFVSCEAATSPELLVSEIAYALHINTENQHLLDIIQTHLRQEHSLLVLDNFETTWDPLETRSEAEDIICSLNWCTGLIVTMRGSQKPSKAYFYKDITLSPLDSQEADSLFCTISKHRDEYVSKLVKAVDCLPLAVTLLANLAAVEGETTESLWARWQEESTSMVENGRGRLNSLDASINMSLTSHSMGSDPGALPFLGLMCMLPDGMSPDFLRACETDFPEPFLVRRAVSTLRRNALVQEDRQHYLKVLNPIRLFVQVHHPPSLKARSFLHAYFLNLALKMSDRERPVIEKLRQEAGNVNAVLCDAIQHSQEGSFERVVDVVFSFCQYSYVSGVGSVQPLLLAEKRLEKWEKSAPKDVPPLLVNMEQKRSHQWKKARRVFSAFGSKSTATRTSISSPLSDSLSQASQSPIVSLRADLLGCAGQLYSRQLEFNKAIEVLEVAQQLHTQVGDRAGEAYDLLNIGLAMHQRKIDGEEKENGKKDVFERALKIHQEIGDLSGQAHSLLAIGYAYCNSSNLQEASDTFLKASDIFVNLKDDAGLASTMYALGMVDQAKSAFAQAEKQFKGAITLYQKTGDQVGQAQALVGIAITWLLRSRFSKALNALSKAMKLREPSVDPGHIHLLGRVYIAQEQWVKAREMLEKSLQLHDTMGDTKGCLADHAYLARIELHAPPLRTAENRHLSIERDDNPHNRAVTVDNDFDSREPHTWDPTAVKCEIYLRYGQLSSAESAASQMVGNLEDVGPLLSVAHAHHLLGVVKLNLGEDDEALKEFDSALALHIQCDNLQGQADDINGICGVLMRRGALHDASVRIQEALALHLKVGYLTGQGDDLYVQGCIYLAQGALKDAEGSIRRALVLHKTSGFIFGQGKDLATLSDILWQQTHSSTASLPLSETDPALDTRDTSIPVSETESNADQLLEEAMQLFTQCRARAEYRQCLKLQTERNGKPWIERVYERRWTDDDDDEDISSEWPLTYDSDY